MEHKSISSKPAVQQNSKIRFGGSHIKNKKTIDFQTGFQSGDTMVSQDNHIYFNIQNSQNSARKSFDWQKKSLQINSNPYLDIAQNSSFHKGFSQAQGPSIISQPT